MKYNYPISIFLCFLSFSQLVYGQFIPEQKNKTVPQIDKKGEVLIGYYVLLSQPHDIFKSTKSYCDNLVRNGAQPPSKNYIDLMNIVYPKALKDINQCYFKYVGKNISKQDVNDYKQSNSDTGTELLDLFGSLNQMGALNSAPQTRSDLNKCSGNEMMLNLYLKGFRDATGYPDKSWCSSLMQKK